MATREAEQWSYDHHILLLKLIIPETVHAHCAGWQGNQFKQGDVDSVGQITHTGLFSFEKGVCAEPSGTEPCRGIPRGDPTGWTQMDLCLEVRDLTRDYRSSADTSLPGSKYEPPCRLSFLN